MVKPYEFTSNILQLIIYTLVYEALIFFLFHLQFENLKMPTFATISAYGTPRNPSESNTRLTSLAG